MDVVERTTNLPIDVDPPKKLTQANQNFAKHSHFLDRNLSTSSHLFLSTMKFLFNILAVTALSPVLPALASVASTLDLEVIGRYNSTISGGSTTEIIAHDPCTQRLFVVNALNDTIDVLSMENATNPTLVGRIKVPTGFEPNSVVVIPGKGAIAVAAENNNSTSNGRVFFFDVEAETFPAPLINTIEVGNRPDMLTLTPDGKYILVANEGELLVSSDPPGSVSIIYVQDGVLAPNLKYATLGFASLDANILRSKGVRIHPSFTPATDFEPEYIAVDPNSEYAYVTLEENNAVLKININEFANLLIPGGVFTFKNADVLPLGSQNHGVVYLDPSDRDGAAGFRVATNIFGLRMPDEIAVFEDKNGKVYFATANEGDVRSGVLVNDQARISTLNLDPTAFPNSATLIKPLERFGRLVVSTVDGDIDGDGDFDKLYAFGSRSFSIFDANGTLVFDSGSDFEYITFGDNPAYFNGAPEFDSRSDDKGPEPEGITIGEIDGRIYAFIGLERSSGVMVYDITVPAESFFVGYENRAGGDLSPEGLVFIDSDDSPTGKPMLVVGYELSGTVTFYNVNPKECSSRKGEKKSGRSLSREAPESMYKKNSRRGGSLDNVRKLEPSKCAKKRVSN